VVRSALPRERTVIVVVPTAYGADACSQARREVSGLDGAVTAATGAAARPLKATVRART
jgi:hypothetical protein